MELASNPCIRFNAKWRLCTLHLYGGVLYCCAAAAAAAAAVYCCVQVWTHYFLAVEVLLPILPLKPPKRPAPTLGAHTT